MKKLNKKGSISLNDLPQVALALLLVGVFFSISLVVLTVLTTNSSVGNGSVIGTANYTLQKTITATSEIPNNWLLLITVIVAAAIVIGIVVSNLGGAAGGRI